MIKSYNSNWTEKRVDVKLSALKQVLLIQYTNSKETTAWHKR